MTFFDFLIESGLGLTCGRPKKVSDSPGTTKRQEPHFNILDPVKVRFANHDKTGWILLRCMAPVNVIGYVLNISMIGINEKN